MKLATILLSLILINGCTPHEVRLADKISRSTVLVHMRITKEGKYAMGTCTGVVVSPHEILLANHCVQPPEEDVKLDKIWIRNFEGRSQEAKIERNDPKVDLALLVVQKKEIPAKIAKSVRVGASCWAVGMPLGIEWVVSKGIVSKIDLEIPYMPDATFFVTDATILPGNSGGGVWNERGELIGIVSMSTSMLGGLGAAGLGFIVDRDTIVDFL